MTITDTAVQSRPVRSRKRNWREPTSALIFLLPMLTLFIVFRFVPVFGSIGMSFTDYRISGEWSLTGVDNYQRMLSDDLFLNSLKITLLYAVIYVPITICGALAAALLLNAVVWGRGLFRGALFLPYVTSFILAGLIWRWVYEIDGLINGLLEKLGTGPIGFLQDSSLVLPSLAVVSAWKGFGYSMLILLAGLKAIPDSYLEAARVDGANAWQRFYRVTLPLLRPVLFFVVVIETIASFQVFDIVYVMTGGGPARASYTLVYALYDQGFRSFDFGYASAIAVVIFLIVLTITLVQRRFLDRESDA